MAFIYIMWWSSFGRSVPGPSSNSGTTPNVIGPSESVEAGVEYGFVLDDEEIDEEARFLVVCIDGDVEDLVLLLEDMARAGETLTKEMLNYPDNSGRVSLPRVTIVHPLKYCDGRRALLRLESQGR